MILFALLLLSPAPALGTTGCRFSRTSGVIQPQFAAKNLTSSTSLSCLSRGCICNSRCLFSFNKRTFVCRIAYLTARPFAWSKSILFTDTADPDWRSFVPDAALSPAERPSALWAFDGVALARNLGDKGSQLDCSTTGLVWTTPGPLQDSSLKYAWFNGGARPIIQNLHSGAYLLNFYGPLTISLWVKAHSSTIEAPIIDGFRTASNSYAAYLWFFPSRSLDQLAFYGFNYVTTTKNASNKLSWRHFAVVQSASGAVTFYLNGAPWPSVAGQTNTARHKPDKISIGYRVAGTLSTRTFKGSLACVAFFQKTLTQGEVESAMNICP